MCQGERAWIHASAGKRKAAGARRRRHIGDEKEGQRRRRCDHRSLSRSQERPGKGDSGGEKARTRMLRYGESHDLSSPSGGERSLCGRYVASSLEIKNPKGKSAYTGIFPGWAVEPSIHLPGYHCCCTAATVGSKKSASHGAALPGPRDARASTSSAKTGATGAGRGSRGSSRGRR